MDKLSAGQDRGLITQPYSAFFTSLADVINYGPTLEGTHAQRVNLNPLVLPFFSPGRFLNYLFWETDRKALYISTLVAGVPTWVVVASGILYDLLANIPAGLTTADAGFLFGASDYKHLFRWGGAAWDFAPGDPGSEYMVGGTPNGALWAPCDGGTYGFAQPGGTVTNKATPNLTGDVFLMGSAAISAQQAETRASWEAGAKTDDEVAHTHSVHVVGNNSYAAGALGAVADQTVLTGAPSTPNGHGLSDANAVLKKPSGGGLPLRIGLTWFARR